ncbi:HD-GYP domain-containing protein [Candidatus Magnetobacterium casense]|uniref:HD-GYP domain-containing protein n=1 Tax=Candidatus Magnetobacterium casense TaxID=1455061 RepID=A0ABS6RV39_9BACT|nr:HD-GYP domain-containing protein [Candidatus Magnetobacterium casensis]MBV6340501.1 HD-GYP domain-containing protein [Candidatus Magnetobacterium casensis]
MDKVKGIHKRLILRLFIGWITISIVAGAVVFFIKLEEIDEFVKDLAVAESRSLIDDKKVYLESSDPEKRKYLIQLLQEHIVKGHFVIVEVYDKDKQKRAEVMAPESARVEKHLTSLDKYLSIHNLSDKISYTRIYFDNSIYLRVFVPLFADDARLIGYFEGVYHVDDKTMNDIKNLILYSLLHVIIAVFATTVLLYPMIISMNKDLIKYSVELSDANIGILRALGGAIAKRDSDTHIHNYRVTIYAVRLAEAMGVKPAIIVSLIKGSFLHDAGKIAISDNILLKPGKLTDDEFNQMKTHVQHGVDIIGNTAWLQDAVEVVRYHHERYDGMGYLAGLKGNDIPLGARMFAITDVFDALTSKRPYKEPFSYDKTVDILKQGRGSHFDPDILDVFLTISRDLYEQVSKGEDTALIDTLDRLTKKYF